MRCLISLVAITAVFVIAILNTIKPVVYGPVFNFALIPLMVSVLFFSFYEVLIIVLTAVLMTLSLLFLSVSLSEIVQVLISLTAVTFCGIALRRITNNALDAKEKVLNVVKEEHRSFYDLDKKSENEKLHLQKTVHDISSLYQAPKEMTSSVTLEELIDCMKRAIVGYFTFSKCKLIIFSFKESTPSIDTVYNLPENGSNGDRDGITGYEEALCDLIKGKNTPLVIDRGSNTPVPDKLKLPESIETFIAIPLIAGNRLNGVFAVEGALLNDMVRFIILGHQFAIVLERIRLYALVQELAIRDGITNAFVRRYFLERFAEEIERAGHFSTKLSFLMIDIDHFKNCNDKFGHLVGDVALKKIADILKSNLREIDIIGRYGGEEFSIMLPETTKEGAAVVGERLREAVERTDISAYDENIRLTISIGIAVFPDDATELNHIIDRADQMLYKAKESGRNRVVVYEEKG